ncbi:MAG: hypothetical protein RML72_01055 [Bacteroidia bacterium]|nr:hypothetical protein [Bacteroidia bacterium]MDW8157453.1 hypothetical protein [Bacteroidia bacterium]
MENIETNSKFFQASKSTLFGGGLLICFFISTAIVFYLINQKKFEKIQSSQEILLKYIFLVNELEQTIHAISKDESSTTPNLSSYLQKQDSLISLQALILSQKLPSSLKNLQYLEKFNSLNIELGRLLQGLIDSSTSKQNITTTQSYLAEIELLLKKIIAYVKYFETQIQQDLSYFQIYFLPLLFFFLSILGIIYLLFYTSSQLLANAQIAFSKAATYRTLHALVQSENQILELDNQRLENQLNHAKLETQKYIQQNQELVKEIETLKKQYTEAEFQAHELNLVKKELEVTLSKCHQLENRLQQCEKEKAQVYLSSNNSDWEKEKNDLEQTIKNLRTQLYAYQAIYNIFQQFHKTAFLTFDVHGKLTSMSKAAEELLEENFSFYQGKEFRNLLCAQTLEEWNASEASSLQLLVHFYKHQQQNEGQPFIFDFMLPNTGRKSIATYIYPILQNNSHKSLGFVLHLV